MGEQLPLVLAFMEDRMHVWNKEVGSFGINRNGNAIVTKGRIVVDSFQSSIHKIICGRTKRGFYHQSHIFIAEKLLKVICVL